MAHLVSDALDALALRKGDAVAEAEAVEAVTPLVLGLVKRQLRASSLRPHAEDLRAEGLIAALKAIRRYDGRGPLTPYLAGCVLLELRRAARKYYSPVGAHIAADDRELNFEDPIFRGHAVFGGHDDDDKGLEESIGAVPMPDHAQNLASDRRRLFLWLRHRGLSAFEREVILRRWGIYWQKASAASGFYRRQARAMHPHTLDEIGRDYDLSGERIRQIQADILVKLGNEARPKTVPRTQQKPKMPVFPDYSGRWRPPQ